jgi:hypothetical protein
MKHSSPTEVGRGQRLSKTWNSRSGSVSLIDWQEPENNAHVPRTTRRMTPPLRERPDEEGRFEAGVSREDLALVRLYHVTAESTSIGRARLFAGHWRLAAAEPSTLAA